MRMRNGRAALVATTFLGSVLVGAPGGAQAADGDLEKARALFEEAGELERRGQWGAAQDRLRGALRLRETPQLHYALGWALENDDKLLEARSEYDLAARLGREKPAGEEATRLATARLAELERTVPILKIHVRGGGASTRVVVDGREIKWEKDSATMSVNPGSHVVRVEQSPDNAIEEIVYVGRGTLQTVEADATPGVALRHSARARHGRSASPTLAFTQHASSRTEGASVVPWLVLSGGVAFIAGSAALLISAHADAGTRDDLQTRWCTLTECRGTISTRPEAPEAARVRQEATAAGETKDTKQALGFALGGAGFVAATVGAFLLLRGDGIEEHASARPKAGGRAFERERAPGAARVATARRTPAALRVLAATGATPLPGGGGIATARLEF